MPTADEIYKEAEKLKDAGDYKACVAKLEEAIAADSNHVLSRLAMAVVLAKLNRHEEAIQHGEHACAADPTDWFNFTALSQTYVKALVATNNLAYKDKAEEAMARGQMLQQGG